MNNPKARDRAALLRGPGCFLFVLALFLPVLQAATITVLSPNGGETICPTHSALIVSWSTSGLPDGTLINVDLYKNGVITNHIFKNSPLTPMSRTWSELNVSGASGDGYKVRIATADGAVADESDAPFTLAHVPMTVRMVTPHGGERWRLGDQVRIEWSCTGCCWGVSTVGITLLTSPWNFYHDTVAGITASAWFQKGYYDWTVGDTRGGKIIPPGSDYKMEVYSIVWGPTYNDVINPNRTWLSPAPFSIFPEGAVLPPLPSQMEKPDTARPAGTPTTPQAASALKIVQPALVHLEPLKVLESLKLLAPVGGEHWTLGQNQRITWSWSGAADRTLKILLFKGRQLVGSLAKDLPAGKGTFDWRAGEIGKRSPAEPGDDYKIEIVAPASGSSPTLRSKSPAAFSLVKGLKILQLPVRK